MMRRRVVLCWKEGHFKEQSWNDCTGLSGPGDDRTCHGAAARDGQKPVVSLRNLEMLRDNGGIEFVWCRL